MTRQILPTHLGQVTARLGAVLLGAQVLLFAFAHWFAPEATRQLLDQWLAVSWLNVAAGHVWTLATYSLVHDVDSPFPIFATLLALYFIAPLLERRWGARGFLHAWVSSVVAGGLAVVALQLLLPAGTAGLTAPVIGASAGIFGLIAAWSWLFPDQRLLLFFIVPVQARWVLPGLIALDLLFALLGSEPSIAANLGGVGGMWLVLNGWTRPRLLRTRWIAWRVRRHRQKVRASLRVVQGGKSDEPRSDADRDDARDDDPPVIH